MGMKPSADPTSHRSTPFHAAQASRLWRIAVAVYLPALALTDHGAMFGAVEFYQEARKAGVKPIVGMEAYVTRGARSDRNPKDTAHHLVLLARDEAGFRNLMRLSSLAYLEGFYYKPRVDHEILAKYSGGLLALSACPKGEIADDLLADRDDAALATAMMYRDMFGPENFFLEILGIHDEIGCTLMRRHEEIVTVGFNLADATKKQAAANPDTEFAIIDDNSIKAKNVKPITFDTSQAAFLAGYTAASVSKTGKVGTFGGLNIPTVTIFMDGYVDGVAHYNETHGEDVQVLGWNKEEHSGSIVGTFEDQSKGKAVSDEFYSAGADIVMPVAGPVGAGTLASAKEGEDRMVIWVDADGYETNSSDPEAQSVILTSVMKEMTVGVEDVITAAAGGEFDATPYVGTLENGGVGLAPYHDFEDEVPAELTEEIDGLKQDIISGDVVVESEASPQGA